MALEGLMNFFQSALAAFGRICVSIIFILSAVSQAMDWDRAEQALTNGICDWMGYTYQMEGMQRMFDYLLPWVSLLMFAGFFLQAVGAILLFFGMKVRLGAFFLILYLVPTTLLFHSFWTIMGEGRDFQMTMFLKNLSIFGGLVVILALGSGFKKSENSSDKEKPA
jgi:uncharacterized membrane protein YphA (DoxX/SURF4 family)